MVEIYFLQTFHIFNSFHCHSFCFYVKCGTLTAKRKVIRKLQFQINYIESNCIDANKKKITEYSYLCTGMSHIEKKCATLDILSSLLSMLYTIFFYFLYARKPALQRITFGVFFFCCYFIAFMNDEKAINNL